MLKVSFNVTGVTFEGRQEVLRRHFNCFKDKVEFVRESDNPYDQCAIKVLVGGEHAGYVPRKDENGEDFNTVFSEMMDSIVDVTFSIGMNHRNKFGMKVTCDVDDGKN